jgi:putative oxidoreductase
MFSMQSVLRRGNPDGPGWDLRYLRLKDGWLRWAPLPTRLIIGFGFWMHGVAKLEKGPEHFVDIVQAIGTPLPHLMAWLTIWVELLGGLAMMLGAFVTEISIPMAAVLLVAMFTVHARFGFTSIKLMAFTADGPKFGPPGVETDLQYLAGLATLVLGGPGPWSIDGWRSRKHGAETAADRASLPDKGA